MTPGAKCYIGTSGWSYPTGEGTWKEYFYPAGTKNELEYYSQFFDTVEVNSSFYRPPSPGITFNWARRVPSHFRFAVKLWQKFTHPAMFKEATGEEPAVSAADVSAFQSSLEPLAAAGKLGIILAQFPPGFTANTRNRERIIAIHEAFSAYPLAVELRHRSWTDDSGTAQLLRERNITWVEIDEPKFSTSIAPEVPATSDIAYFRFHGRNAREWWHGTAETRYRYLYNAEEINELAAKVRRRMENTRFLYAYFNNHWQAYAPRNASDLKRALGLPVVDFQMQMQFPEEEKKGMPFGGDDFA